MPRPRKWTDDQLRTAVAESQSIAEVIRRLGLVKSGGTYAVVREHMLLLGLDWSHLGARLRSPRWSVDPRTLSPAKPRGRQWSDQDLAKAVARSHSVAGVLRELGLKVGGGQYVAIQRRIAELGLDRSHFTGKGWTKGLKNPTRGNRRPLDVILVEHSDYTSTHNLKQRLLKEGLLQPRCDVCQRTAWEGKPIPLQLDHINGVRTDNRIQNLRLLCPNCHAQTDTYCGKNKKRVSLDDGDTMDMPSPGGETGYTAVSRIAAERREGSNPSPGTQLLLWPETGSESGEQVA